MAQAQPLPLTAEERDHIKTYLSIFKSYDQMRYDGNVLDGNQVTNYLCEIMSTRSRSHRLPRSLFQTSTTISPTLCMYFAKNIVNTPTYL